jgi:Zn-dependent peptidase ImmA (M78 family)/transcriptional regulator with XRE-family HTH domain
MSTPTTPYGFVGARLTEARQSVGLKVAQLAKLAGTSRQMLYRYESGDAEPSHRIVERLSDVLGQPLGFFFNGHVVADFAHKRVHYRSNKIPDYERDVAAVRLKWMIEYYRLLQDHLELPSLQLPSVSVPHDVMAITDSVIEQAATALRDLWKLGHGPIPNLVHAAELNGVVLQAFSLDLERLDGLSLWSEGDGRAFVLLNRDKASAVRSRFDLAHELGHMILHHRVSDVLQHGEAFKLIEAQAHRFAGALLLPADAWTRDIRVTTLGAFQTLKPKWRVSIGVMIKRAFQLGLIDRDREQSLWKQYSAKRWRQREPYDDVWSVEEPQLFKQGTDLLLSNSIGPATLPMSFPRAPSYISELTGVPVDALTDVPGLPLQRAGGGGVPN